MTRETRSKAKFAFLARQVEIYRPTPGQAAAFSMIAAAKTREQKVKSLHRFFAVIEALVVSKAAWDWMEEQLITGKADISDYADFMKAVFEHVWDEASEDAGE